MQQKSKKAKSCAFVRAAEFSSFIIHSDLGKKGLLLKNDGNGFYLEAGNGRLHEEHKAHRIRNWASWSDAQQMSSTNVVDNITLIE